MSIEEELRRLADNAAQQAQHRAATLEQQALELEEEVARKRAAGQLARTAFERLANFPVAERGNHFCPDCWIDRGQRSILRAVPGGSSGPRGDDVYRCGVCGPIRIQATY
jgi:hypothetical protein